MSGVPNFYAGMSQLAKDDPIVASMKLRAADAEHASRELADRIHRQFRKFELRHGLMDGEGEILLMNTGVRK
jgi:hypothetical protein